MKLRKPLGYINCRACGTLIQRRTVSTVFCGSYCKEQFYSRNSGKLIVCSNGEHVRGEWPHSWELP